MRRGDLAGAVARHLGPRGVVVCGLGSTARAWRENGNDAPTYYASDPMGLAPALALGVALARADLEVLLLEGDGDLLMNMGVLATIAGAAPTNLRMIVFNNGRYETGGGQPLAAASQVDLAGIARSAGWRSVGHVDEDVSVDDQITELMSATGPAMLVAGVEPEDAPYGGPGERSGVEERWDFQRELAVRRPLDP